MPELHQSGLHGCGCLEQSLAGGIDLSHKEFLVKNFTYMHTLVVSNIVRRS
jgi:hypothetical protein